ncbi:hypothetical protein EVA_14001 [gut metagenome]|uniref:Homeodomain phBC6A51-type domain-containing protein n=1 Tax=gut metagenome TaxID=749906 RepID=J9FTQ8_9ZZZZ
MAEKLMDPTFRGTITELCTEFSVARSTLYRWIEKSEFTDYLDELADKYASSELGTVWKALIKQCSEGNIQAIKLYFELRDVGRVGKKSAEVQIVDDV